MARGRWLVDARPDGTVHVELAFESAPGSPVVSWDTDADMAEDLGKLLVHKAQRARQLAVDL